MMLALLALTVLVTWIVLGLAIAALVGRTVSLAEREQRRELERRESQPAPATFVGSMAERRETTIAA